MLFDGVGESVGHSVGTVAATGAPAHLPLPDVLARQLGLIGPLTLRRAWPKKRRHNALEYVDAEGRLVPGQWFADSRKAAAVAKSTRRATGDQGQVVQLAGGHLLLQVAGADRKLLGLARLLARPDATLMVHRPERRAVVKLGHGLGARFAKVLPPAKAAAMAAQLESLAGLAGDRLRIPTLHATDLTHGVVVMEGLPGQSLHSLLADPRLPAYLAASGAALRTLHTLAPPAGSAVHDVAAELGVIDHWLGRVAEFAPALLPVIRAYAAPVRSALAALQAPATPALLHRDFYDKQIIVDPAGGVGLLDFDTLAVGDPALDLANMLVHLELRADALGGDGGRLLVAGGAFLAGYGAAAVPAARLQAYADATRLRLACVYAMRPPQAAAVAGLLRRVGAPIPVPAASA